MFKEFIILNPLSSGGTGAFHPSSRLAEITSKISEAESAIQTLESLLTIAILYEDNQEMVDKLLGSQPGEDFEDLGFNPLDPSEIRQGLYAARAYEGELRSSEQFWMMVQEENKKAEAKTHDLIKPG